MGKSICNNKTGSGRVFLVQMSNGPMTEELLVTWLSMAVRQAASWLRVAVLDTIPGKNTVVSKKHQEGAVVWAYRSITLDQMPSVRQSLAWNLNWYCMILHEIAHAAAPLPPERISLEQETNWLLSIEESLHRQMGTLSWWRMYMWRNWWFQVRWERFQLFEMGKDFQTSILKNARKVARRMKLIPAPKKFYSRKMRPPSWPGQKCLVD